MEYLFHHHYFDENVLTANPLNTKVIKSISVHPFKNSDNLYKMQIFFDRHKIMELRQRRLQLERTTACLVESLYNSHTISTDSYKIRLIKSPRTILTIKRSLKSTTQHPRPISTLRENRLKSNILFFRPPRYVEKQWRMAVSESLRQVSVLNDPVLDQFLAHWHRTHFYYMQNDQITGLHYTFSYFKNLKKNSKVPLKQGSISIHQPLSDIFFRDDAFFNSNFYHASNKAYGYFNKNLPINFIVPLSGRFDRFQEFMRNFEEVCFKGNEKVSLKLVLFTSTNSSSFTTPGSDEYLILEFLKNLKNKYPLHNVDALKLSGNFSRAIACQEGANSYSNDSLLTFIDVDISFTPDFLYRVRMNTVKGKQVYFPIVFSQYENVPEEYSSEVLRNYSSPTIIKKETGYWRQYGYGMASVYKQDLEAVKGFNTEIVGWGLEDVDLFDKFVMANYTIFRSADPGLVHVYHGIECNAMLDKHRLKMCITNFYSTHGSQVELARKVHVNLTTNLMDRK